MADRGAAPHAAQQPRRGGRRASRAADRLRRLGQGRSQPRRAARARPQPPRAGRGRDAARSEREAGGHLQDARGRPARAHRQFAARAALGDLGRVPQARGARPDDVRPDDRRELDLHRHPGHPPGDVPDVRGRRGDALRLARPARSDDSHRGPGRHGRRAAAGGDDGRRRDPVHRRRSLADRAATRDPLSGRGVRLGRGRRRTRAERRCRGTCALGRRARERGRDRARPRSARRGLRPRDRPDGRPRPAERLRARRALGRRGGRAARSRPRRVPAAGVGVHCAPRRGHARVRPGRELCFRLRQQPSGGGATGRHRGRVHIPGLCPGLYPAALLPRHRPFPLGRALWGSGRHRSDRRGAARALPGRPPSAALARRWPRSGSRSRASRRASAGSATAIAPRRASPSTSSCATGG